MFFTVQDNKIAFSFITIVSTKSDGISSNKFVLVVLVHFYNYFYYKKENHFFLKKDYKN